MTAEHDCATQFKVLEPTESANYCFQGQELIFNLIRIISTHVSCAVRDKRSHLSQFLKSHRGGNIKSTNLET